MKIDNITDERLSVIKELANRKPQIEAEKPFPTVLYYGILSFILFAITHNTPGAIKVWIVAAAIGMLIGIIHLAIKAANYLDEWVKEDERKRKYH